MDLYISIIVGSIQAIVFNPLDKAIYNSIINNNSLFYRKNWIKPFSGTTNGIYSRIISGGLYYYLIDYSKNMNIYQSSLFVSISTSILNPFNVVKFSSYSNNLTTYNSLLLNYKKYGLKFGKIGIESLILRDFIFNYIYIKYKKDNYNLLYNCSIICAASIISSPLHYIRNMKYYNNDTYINIIKNLFKEMNNKNLKTLFIFKQFGIGYGTIRTVIGVYSGQLMYSTMIELLKK